MSLKPASPLRKGRKKLGLALAIGATVVSAGLAGNAWLGRDDSAAVEQHLAAIEKTLEPELEYSGVIPKRSTLSQVLRDEGFSPLEIHGIVEAAKPYRDLARVNAGTGYHVEREGAAASVIGLRFKFSAFEHLILQRQVDGQWRARMQVDKIETRLVTYDGLVTSSLWDSATNAEMDPQLIVSLTELFAWQVDFAREVQQNDRWRLSVEEKLVRGKRVGWGRILAAEYENVGRMYTAVLHQHEGKDLGYFAPDGSSLRRIFLKSPLKFGRITSGFSRKRFHPVLKISRPHRGIDYGAPTGTPIMSVGDGRVAFAGRKGGGGNTITIRHNAVYSTNYLHLSRFAPGVRAGTSVRQGQIIGYVGATGLATGPHLHFEFCQHGNHVDPMRLKFPSADPVPKEQMPPFVARSLVLMQTLPGWDKIDRKPAGPGLVAKDLTRRVLLDFAPAAATD